MFDRTRSVELHTGVKVKPKNANFASMAKTQAQTLLSVGELARATGASARSIRHYDDNGLLSSSRAGNGYRVFPLSAVTQVRQIQRLIASGFSLAEIRGFPDCMRRMEGAPSCPETRDAQRRRLASIERQIAELEQRRARLRSMLAQTTRSSEER